MILDKRNVMRYRPSWMGTAWFVHTLGTGSGDAEIDELFGEHPTKRAKVGNPNNSDLAQLDLWIKTHKNKR